MLVLMRSVVERPNRRSTEYDIRLIAAPVSTNILFIGLPSMKPLRYNPFRCLKLFSLGFSKMIGRGPRSSCAMANSSGWGARNSDGSTNTMFTSADGFSSAFVCLGRHSILGGGGGPLFPLRSPNLLHEIRTRFPQHVKILRFHVFEVAQALYSALL